MCKSTHFIGQALCGLVINLLNRSKIMQSEHGGERYIKRFDCWTHLVVMLYAIIMRFDSLREITASLQAEARKLHHLGISVMPSRSTLADANKRRPELNLSLRPYIVTCMTPIIPDFLRTAEPKPNLNG